MFNHGHNMIKGLIAGCMFALGVVFDEHALVPIGSITVIAGGIWWLGRKLQKLEDGQESLREGQQHINTRLDGLPCNENCGVTKRK